MYTTPRAPANAPVPPTIGCWHCPLISAPVDGSYVPQYVKVNLSVPFSADSHFLFAFLSWQPVNSSVPAAAYWYGGPPTPSVCVSPSAIVLNDVVCHVPIRLPTVRETPLSSSTTKILPRSLNGPLVLAVATAVATVRTAAARTVRTASCFVACCIGVHLPGDAARCRIAETRVNSGAAGSLDARWMRVSVEPARCYRRRVALELRLLGPVEALADGRPVRLSPRPRAVLAVLALHAGQVVPAPRLIDAVWA